VEHDLSNSFGKCIKSLRQQNGWSQEKLAERSGVHPTHIGLIERGNRNPSIDVADAIANALGQKLSFLIEIAEQGLEVSEEE
jgi:XRE family transcriptional regulator, regulator of sulfur utilization